VVWDPLLTRWYEWEWDDFGLACVELYDLSNPFVDHTLRLIQYNWVASAYNFNLVILVLIIGVTYRSISSFYYSFILGITLHYHFIPTLAEYQPLVYSTLLFYPATQTCCLEGDDRLEFFDEEF
jgi:hypothetical protein